MYQQCREMIQEAKASGLAAVVWSYPRGTDISQGGRDRARRGRLRGADRRPARRARHQGEAAHGAHRAGRGQEGLREGQASRWPRSAERVRHVVQSAFDGRRIVIFSGGATKEDDEAFFDECRGIRDGGGVRLHHRPQLLPAAARPRAQVPGHRDEDLLGRDEVGAARPRLRPRPRRRKSAST